MSKLELLAKIGLWPRCLNADLAAIYVGVSKSDFYRKVDDGTYPRPFENGGHVQWDKGELDEAVEALKLKRKTKAAPAAPDAPETMTDHIGEALQTWNPKSSAS